MTPLIVIHRTRTFIHCRRFALLSFLLSAVLTSEGWITQSNRVNHKFKFTIVVTEDDFTLVRTCGGCTVLLELRDELSRKGYEVNTHQLRKGNKCRGVDRRTVVVYPEIVSWTCLGQPLLNVRWILAPVGINSPANISEGWSTGDWVYNYGSFASGTKIDVPDNNLLVVFNDWWSQKIQEMQETTAVPRAGWCYTERKARSFHSGAVTFLHPFHAKRLPDSIAEITKTFSENEYFMSYDPFTMYSLIAPCFGCIPIIAALDGKDKASWFNLTAWAVYARETERYLLRDAVAYGSEPREVARARANMPLVQQELKRVQHWGKRTVTRFCDDVEAHIAGDIGRVMGRRYVSDFY